MVRRWIAAARERLRTVFRPSAFDADLDEELQFHLDAAVRRHRARGLSLHDARLAAARQLGSVGVIKESVRDEIGIRAWQDLGQDLRQAGRQLIRRPGLSAIVIVTIAVCIAAYASVFSVVHSVLLEPLPFPDSDRLVRLYNSYPAAGMPRMGTSPPEYFDRREFIPSLEDLALFREEANTLRTDSGGEHTFSLRVTPSFFSALRVSPAIGRLFHESDAVAGAPPSVVIGHALWQSALGGSRHVLGNTIDLDGTRHTVVGVLPQSFRFSTWAAQVFTPLMFGAEDRAQKARHTDGFQMIARLAPTATVDSVQAEVTALNTTRLSEYPDSLRRTITEAGYTTVVRPYLADLTQEIRQPLLLLWAGVLLVVVIGIANITGLLLLRARSRSREMAVRMALGAGPVRVMRQLLAESALLAVIGGATGLALARASLRLLSAFEVYEIPRVDDVAIGGVVAGTVAIIVIVSTAVMGAVPALTILRRRHHPRPDSSRTTTPGSTWPQRALVSSQIALALVLVMTAGLLVASLRNLLAVDPGFERDHVAVGALILPGSRYPTAESRIDFINRTLETLQALPGVISAATASQVPFSGSDNRSGIVPEGVALDPGEAIGVPAGITVSAGYFETLGIDVVSGRTFLPSDSWRAPGVVIIDQTLARRYWPNVDPVGRRLWFGTAAGRPSDARTIVGVVEPVAQNDLRTLGVNGAVYLAVTQNPSTFFRFAVKYEGDLALVWPAVRERIATVDPQLVPFWSDTLGDSVAASLLFQRAPMQLLSGFALLGLFLGVIGVYGVMAHEFGSRRHEIAVRMAIGGSRWDIAGLMTKQWLLIVGSGAVVGLVAALASAQLVASLLFGTGSNDPMVTLTALAALFGAALLATVIPVRRAVRIDPAIALREE